MAEPEKIAVTAAMIEAGVAALAENHVKATPPQVLHTLLKVLLASGRTPTVERELLAEVWKP